MNKHERAVRLIRRSRDLYEYSKLPEPVENAEAMDYAMKVLEAVEGVEGWMPAYLRCEPNTDQWESYIARHFSADPQWDEPDDVIEEVIAATLQALLDAKGEGDG